MGKLRLPAAASFIQSCAIATAQIVNECTMPDALFSISNCRVIRIERGAEIPS
jgi:hypothetical protein